MMLDRLGETRAAARVRAATGAAVTAGQVTPDLGGTLRTRDVEQALLAAMSE